MQQLILSPLPPETLSPAIQNVLGGASSMKLMVVRGMAPMRPAEFLVAIYQLSFDSDVQVRSQAESAPGTLPDRVLLGPLADHLPPPVLHFFADKLPTLRTAAIEKILYNNDTLDDTFVLLASKLDEQALEIIVQNELRLLRCPRIVEALYFNKQARMSSVRRTLELCVRNQVRPENIPAFDEIAAELLNDPTPSAPDEVLGAILSLDAPVVSSATEIPVPAPGADAPEEVKKRLTSKSFIKFDELKIFEKVRLATVGNAYCRQVLIRDTNKLVAMSVIRSPSMTDMEVVAAASNRAICDDVIRFIAGSREFTKDYAVKSALVNNPKCPLASSLRLLSFLRPDDLKNLSRSKNIPGALATAAKKLLQTRERSG